MVVQHFVDASIKGANAAADRALPRIQKHAPVRHIFAGTTHTESHGFRVPKQIRFQRPEVGGAIAGRFNRDVGRGGELADNTIETSTSSVSRLGHPNALIPVFRTRKPGYTQLASGDLRRTSGAELSPVRTDIVFRQGSKLKAGKSIVAPGTNLLTAHGRYEVKSGRANFLSSAGVGERPQMRVGGRLRGEIYIEPATYDGKEVWAYIVSPTKDPVTGYPYNRAMEYGSLHNRAHPFMRPGLHESRDDLTREVGRNVKAGSQR